MKNKKMHEYVIKRASYQIGEDGVACGPAFGPVVAEVVTEENGKDVYFTISDFDGMPEIYKTKKSVMQSILAMDEDKMDDIQNHTVWSGDYDDLEEETGPDSLIYRYLAYLSRASEDETKALIKASTGKKLGEFEIPEYDDDDEDDEEEDDDEGLGE